MSSSDDALRVEEVPQDLVRRARIDVVRPQELEPLGAPALLAHQVLERRDGLLIRRRAGVKDVVGRLFALVLHRIEEETIQLLEDGQHGLSRDGRPATEDGRHLVLPHELPGLLGEERPVGGGVDDDGLDLLAEQAALGVELLDRHQVDVPQRGLADGHCPRERVKDSDLDRVTSRRRRLRRLGARRRRWRGRGRSRLRFVLPATGGSEL